jgi:hypothetical protein
MDQAHLLYLKNMAYFAQLDDDSNVIQVIVLNDSDALTEEEGVAFCQLLLGENTNWKQTDYSGNTRRQFAGIGFKYITEADIFLEPMPQDGFTYVLNQNTLMWESTDKPPIYVGFAPSSVESMEELFTLVGLTANDTFVDLGCGDGRVVIAAAKQCAGAVGIEANPELYRQSQIDAELANVPAQFFVGDLVNADVSPYTVIYMYLGGPLCEAVLPKIKALPAGRTIISGDYCYPNWAPVASYVLGGRDFYVWKT